VTGSPAIPEPVKSRLARLAGSRLTDEGVLVLFAQEHRSQTLNRAAARERLAAILRAAAIAPKRRRPTRPTRASRLERLQAKTRRAGVKALRGKPGSDEH
jgi:ribosome-associated protein